MSPNWTDPLGRKVRNVSRDSVIFSTLSALKCGSITLTIVPQLCWISKLNVLGELEGKHIITLLQCSVCTPECIKPPAVVFVCLLLLFLNSEMAHPFFSYSPQSEQNRWVGHAAVWSHSVTFYTNLAFWFCDKLHTKTQASTVQW